MKASRLTASLVMSWLVISTSQQILSPPVFGRIREPQRRSRSRKPNKPVTKQPAGIDYSKFSHTTHVTTQKLSCDACHTFPTSNWKEVRKGDEAFPDVAEYPQHVACVSCHNQQFFRGAKPVICANCHVSISPQSSPRFPFPSLGEAFFKTEKARDFDSEFSVFFPHDKHIDVVAALMPGTTTNKSVRFVFASHRQESSGPNEASCGVCHKTYQPQGDAADDFVTPPPKDWPDGAFWLKKGAFKTTPMTHATCSTCHSQDSGLPPAPSECNACHKLVPAAQLLQPNSDFEPNVAAMMKITDNLMLMRWRKREASAFRHEWFSHAELKCASCHNVTTLNTTDEKSKKVPVTTCGGPGEGCHITATADEGGILNYVVEQRKADPAFQCRKCHTIFGKKPVPQSHLDAIAALKKK